MVGTWKLEKNEKLTDYMKGKGVGMVKRNLANQASVTFIVKKEDDKVKVDVSATGGNKGNYVYELGKELACKSLQNDDQKRTMKIEDGVPVVTIIDLDKEGKETWQ